MADVAAPGRKPRPLCVYSCTNFTKCCWSGLVAIAMAIIAMMRTPRSHRNTLLQSGRLHDGLKAVIFVSLQLNAWSRLLLLLNCGYNGCIARHR